MFDFLLAPIDPSRAHEINSTVSWHARSMVLAWGVGAPTIILVTRFFKVMPGQNWPEEVDNLFWWRSHWMGQSLVFAVTLLGLSLVLPLNLTEASLHDRMGIGLCVLLLIQVLHGILRGSQGGPSAPKLRGHHYDMTRWRRMFETMHKTIGYGALGASICVILTGLWNANAPVWMWLAIGAWWSALIWIFNALQRRGMAVDTYQAIWGVDRRHPGNRLPHPKWGVRRWNGGQKQCSE